MIEKLSYVTGISHIGVAVENIERAAAQYELLGFTPSYEGTLRDETRGVQIKMMKNGGYAIELVAPLTAGAASPVDAYIQPKCYMMYHVCYTVSDLDAQMALLRQNKFVPVDEPRPSDVLGGRRAVFMLHRKMGILELAEEGK